MKLEPSQVPGLAGMTAAEIQGCVAELTGRGYCLPAAHGELVYITREGAKLAQAGRTLVERGVALADITLDALGPHLRQVPFFQLPSPLRVEAAGARSSASAVPVAG